MAMLVVFMSFGILRSIKFGMLRQLGKEILDNSYQEVTALGICIHIKRIYIKLQRCHIKIIVNKWVKAHKSRLNEGILWQFFLISIKYEISNYPVFSGG